MTMVFSFIWSVMSGGSEICLIMTDWISTPWGMNWRFRRSRISAATRTPCRVPRLAVLRSAASDDPTKISSESEATESRSESVSPPPPSPLVLSPPSLLLLPSLPFFDAASYSSAPLRMPYIWVCLMLRASARTASSWASLSCCSSPRGFTSYTNFRTNSGSSPRAASPIIRKTSATSTFTVTLSFVLHAFTGRSKTMLCMVIRLDTPTQGGCG
mmetsp:Transcript_6966/g.20897  ORF Transcript_6966/g.20897 Transcript_6966/m.20897 type:complete len:214 (+) Transcript_6966:1053-1694(+)